ncbi:hypothetical protein [Streptomyces sp. NPDC050546]|uniref:hypothetical protein n=1 Tax=Streptomyces sp. NPDC050546 TaxID=3365628 RepID=UPI0037905294
MPVGIPLPQVPVPLSRRVLGRMTFGDPTDRTRPVAVPEAALATGITGVDPADGCAARGGAR